MAKITELPLAGPITGDETVPIVQGAAMLRTSLNDLAAPAIAEAQAARDAAEEARDQVVTNTLKRVNLWPDPLFREIAATGNYPLASSKSRSRMTGTWEKLKSAQSPYASGFSMKLAAGVANAAMFVSVVDPGRELAVAQTLNLSLSLSGGGTATIGANWFGAGGNIGSFFTVAPNTALSSTAVTVTNTVTITVPDGATALRLQIGHSGTAADKFVHAVWVQAGGSTILSDPSYRYELPADAMWRLRDLESRANGNVTLRRVSYSSLTAPLAVTGGSASAQNNAFVGWGARFTPAGVSFNAVALPGVLRNTGSTNWRKLVVMVRRGASGTSHQKGTLIALGSIDLDPNVTSYPSKLYIPLRDPETDAFKTLTDTDLGDEYFIGYYAVDAAGVASSVGLCSGTTTNMVGTTGYRLQTGSQADPLATWITDTNGVGIEHCLLVSPADSYIPSATFSADVLALSAGDPKAAWGFAQRTDYDTLAVQVAATDASTNSVYGTGYSGYGARCVSAGVSFNALRVARLSRNPAVATAANTPATINVIVKSGTTGTTWATGTIVAVGSIPVPLTDFDYRDLVIPLVDPTTGVAKTLTNADLGAQYNVAFYALTSSGANAQINPPEGRLSNAVAANEQFLLTGATSALTGAWAYSTPAASIPLEHVLLTNARTGYKPAHNVAVQVNSVDPRLTLPPKIYGVQGRELNIYLDALSPTELRDIDYRFQFGSTQGVFHGQHQAERWTLTPGATPINQAFTVTAYDRASGERLASASSTLVTVASATTNQTLKYLAIGDSITAFTTSYVEELSVLQTADANLKLTFQGTKSTGGIAHEGISGWTSTQWYSPTVAGDQTQNKFYNSGTGLFDYATYLTATSQTAADVVSFHLGINDLGVADNDQAAESRSFQCGLNIERMIASVKVTNAAAKFIVCLTIPPALSQDGFTSSSNNAYNGRRPLKRQRRNHIIMARELLRRFGGREADGIYIASTNLALDTERGFPVAAAANASARSTVQVARVTDAIHPNTSTGILQVADAIWAMLKVVFA